MKKLTDQNRLSIKFPEIAAQLHPIKNGNLTPEQISYGSQKRLWWKCKFNHEWATSVANRTRGTGCPYCAGLVTKTTTQFIEQSIDIHGNKYLYHKTEYKNARTKLTITCKLHGDFQQTPHNHVNKKYGCMLCGGSYKFSQQEFIDKAISIHGYRYDYTKSIYNGTDLSIIITCKKHGDFNQTPYHHINRSQGCPRCKESNGECKIRCYLENNKIPFKQECSFKSCKDKGRLRFDFCLFISNIRFLVEFHGTQHYELWIDKLGDKAQDHLDGIKRRDKIKQDWAAANDIPLLIIPYWEIDNIERILDEFLAPFKSEVELTEAVA